jgi:hypothetical protein
LIRNKKYDTNITYNKSQIKKTIWDFCKFIRVEGLMPRPLGRSKKLEVRKNGFKPEYNHQSRTNKHRCSAAVFLIAEQ